MAIAARSGVSGVSISCARRCLLRRQRCCVIAIKAERLPEIFYRCVSPGFIELLWPLSGYGREGGADDHGRFTFPALTDIRSWV
jgi:hypothetical protein